MYDVHNIEEMIEEIRKTAFPIQKKKKPEGI